MTMDIGAKLVSTLGSPKSRIPLGVKDGFNTAGYTFFSYEAGGIIEGEDRLADEIATFAVWMGSIPVFGWLFDKGIFSRFGISPKVDFRVIKNKNYLKEAIANAPTEKIKKELETAGNRKNAAKNLNLAKFGFAMGMTWLLFHGLTKLRQKMTKLSIEKEFHRKMNEKIVKTNMPMDIPDVFKDIKNCGAKNKTDAAPAFLGNDVKNSLPPLREKFTPSFGSSKIVDEFLLDPIKNMVILDCIISGERLYASRTDGEFKEYAIKEGSFIFFAYAADRLIKKGLEWVSKNILKIPVELDAKFLASNLSSDILKDENLQKEVKTFNTNFNNDISISEMYKSIFQNQDNVVVKAAKESGIIATVKDEKGNERIDTRKYIDLDEIKQLGEDLQNYIDSAKNSGNIKKYLEKVRALKILVTAIGIGSCCLFLGYIVPKYIYQTFRPKHQNGNNNFHVRAEYEKELATRASQNYAA